MANIRSRNLPNFQLFDDDGERGLADNRGILPDWRTLEEIRAFCESLLSGFTQDEYEAARNSAIADADRQDQEERKANREQEQRPAPKLGFVYVMYDANLLAHKIGFSQNPKYRERTLQAQKPSISLIASYPGTLADEAYLHREFEGDRIRGEWFYLNPEDVEIIGKLMTDKPWQIEGGR